MSQVHLLSHLGYVVGYTKTVCLGGRPYIFITINPQRVTNDKYKCHTIDLIRLDRPPGVASYNDV